VVALDKENLLSNVLGIVVPASLMLLNSFFENVEFVLVTAPLGVPFEPRPKEPQDSDRDDDVREGAANVPGDEVEDGPHYRHALLVVALRGRIGPTQSARMPAFGKTESTRLACTKKLSLGW
jgi:hypothetical protein